MIFLVTCHKNDACSCSWFEPQTQFQHGPQSKSKSKSKRSKLKFGNHLLSLSLLLLLFLLVCSANTLITCQKKSVGVVYRIFLHRKHRSAFFAPHTQPWSCQRYDNVRSARRGSRSGTSISLTTAVELVQLTSK